MYAPDEAVFTQLKLCFSTTPRKMTMQQSSPTRSTLIILALLLLTGCGTPRPSTEIAQLTPSPAARSTATSTPRRPTATARPAAPTAPPATTAALPPTTAPTSAPLPTPTAIAARAKAVVRNGGNVRRIPATGEPLDQVHAHEQVPLIGKNADASWYLLVTARGVTGWVSATLLTIEPAGIAQVPVVPETTQGQAASGPASDAWTTHTINESTIQLPSAWKVLPITDADLERAARELEGENAALAAMMRNILASGQATQMRFFAMDPATGTNVGMLAIPRPAGTPDELLSQVVDTLPKMAPMMKFISRDSKHHVNGWPAARVAYDLDMPLADGSTVTLRGVQWYVVGANQVFIITISGATDDALISLGDRIGQSFSLPATAESSAATGERRQVINGGNLRQSPAVNATNIIGQVCPGDHIAILDRPEQPRWKAVRVEVTGPNCDPQRVPAGTEGWVSTSLLGEPLAQDGAAALPPSLLITRLVPFTHAVTSITGLRPENWQIFDNGTSFQISSSPEAPDGLTGRIIEPSEYPQDGAAGAIRTVFAALKQNVVEGPPPEVHEEQLNADGSGLLLVTTTGVSQGNTRPVRMTWYARTTVTERGILVVVGVVPAELFPQEQALMRQMVDSLRVTD